jgi:hypothetical protein
MKKDGVLQFLEKENFFFSQPFSFTIFVHQKLIAGCGSGSTHVLNAISKQWSNYETEQYGIIFASLARGRILA